MRIIATFFGDLSFLGTFALLTSKEIHALLPHCPKRNSEYIYEDNDMHIYPERIYEQNDAKPTQESGGLIVKDANGDLLVDDDGVTIIRDLEVESGSSMLKIGTKVKNIRLVESNHNIDCKIDGFGLMKLKSEFVKKN